MATVGLGSLAGPIAGTMLAGLLLRHNCIYVQFFKYTLIYTKQTINHSYDTHFSLAKHASWSFSQTCAVMYVSCNAWPSHMLLLFCSANMCFLHVFKAFDDVRKKHTQWFCETCFVFFLIRFKFVVFVLHNAFHGVFELAKRWEHVSKNIKL